MFDTNVINDIDLCTDEAELDVLFSVCESYAKILSIIAESEDTVIVQENYSLFMEADNADKKSIKEIVLGIIGKLCEALKNIIVKIIDVFNRRILKRENHTMPLSTVSCYSMLLNM